MSSRTIQLHDSLPDESTDAAGGRIWIGGLIFSLFIAGIAALIGFLLVCVSLFPLMPHSSLIATVCLSTSLMSLLFAAHCIDKARPPGQ